MAQVPPEISADATILSSYRSKGKVGKIAGLDAYVVGSTRSKQCILLIADEYGFQVQHLRDLADKLAASSYYVVVPDFFDGDSYVNEDWVNWIHRHPADKITEDAISVILALKKYPRIGCGSFGWSAQIAARISTSYQYIQASVMFYPAFVNDSKILGIRVPVSILGAQNDTITPLEEVKKYEKILQDRNQTDPLPVEYFVKTFTGVRKGFMTRYGNNPNGAKIAAEALKYMLDWFDSYVRDEN